MEAESRQEPEMGSPLNTGMPALGAGKKALYAQTFFAVVSYHSRLSERAARTNFWSPSRKASSTSSTAPKLNSFCSPTTISRKT